MLGLGAGAAALPIKQWEPTDNAKLEMWLQAHTDFLTTSAGSPSPVTRWRTRYPGYTFDQSTAVNMPVFDSTQAEYAVKFVTDASASEDDVLLEADDQVSLDTSADGWTMAFTATCTDWDGANQVFFGQKDTNDNFVRATSGFDGFGVKIDGTLKSFALDTPSSLTDNTFYHIMFTATSGGTVTLYIDNVAQTDTEEFGSKNFVLDEIGGKNNLSQTLTGSIKEIQIFNAELSSLEREECYNFMTNRMNDHSS